MKIGLPCYPMNPFKYAIGFMVCCCSVVATNLEYKEELILQNPSLEAYHGWLKYLDYRIDDAVFRLGPDHAETVNWIEQRDEWIGKILENPNALYEVRGAQEWAYFSRADDSGQPFRFATPQDYDPEKSYGLQIYVHGYSGNHIEHLPDMPSIPGNFRLSVLGRARGGFYQNLSENDVMEVIRFMMRHWNIDPQKVHLSGGSMGGWASFYLSNRYPHLFASARPTCGFAPNLPVGNWLHVPFYATHSIDDPVVPIVMSRTPLKALRSMGGEVIMDETDGLGHASWDYADGNRRSDAWYGNNRAPLFSEVTQIDFTATDEKARQAYWATIETWGEAHEPAQMQLSYNASNDLYVSLKNAKTISIDVEKSPIQKDKDLDIMLNGAPPVSIKSPIPEKLFLTCGDAGVLAVSESDPWVDGKGAGKHFPGGARNLYNGDPILVVWGTQGNESQNAAMAHAAIAAMRNAHPALTSDEGERGQDGVIHEHMTYSRLKGKPDVDVTEDDIKNHHLVLIGSAELNLVAKGIAGKLPVKIQNDSVVCDDGVAWSGDHLMTFLSYFNPIKKDRRIYWYSTDSVDFFNKGAGISYQVQEPGGGNDLVVMESQSHALVAARTLDTEWEWTKGYAESAKIPESQCTPDGWFSWLASVYRSATGADMAIVNTYNLDSDSPFKAGVARYADYEPFLYEQRLAVMELNVSQLETLSALLSKIEDRRGVAQLYPSDSVQSEKNSEDRIYRIATTLDAWWSIAAAGKFAPESLRYTDVFVIDAFRSFQKRN